MTDPYLIAHKVRGEPAFDVAVRMECPLCDGYGKADPHAGLSAPCHECDGLGYWWIISTSGHRAYPWTHWAFADIELSGSPVTYFTSYLEEAARLMPCDVQDHYPHSSTTPTTSLTERLGIGKTPAKPIDRRI